MADAAWVGDPPIRLTRYVRQSPEPPQIAFLLVDHIREALYGGAAGGGKSSALLTAALQFVDVAGYSALLLRRTFRDLGQPDALIPRSKEWLAGTDAHWNDNDHRWTFPSGATLTFGYLQHEDDKLQYQGAAFQFIGFDELTQFTETQYRYLFSRLRRPKLTDATSDTERERIERLGDVPLRMRVASNPGGPGHDWVKLRFGLHRAEGDESGPYVCHDPKWVRENGRIFVPAKVDDNPHLDREDYEQSLAELDPVTRAHLRSGDWDATEPGDLFRRQWFDIATKAPEGTKWVRWWDLAATEPSQANPDPDWTAGVKLGVTPAGSWVVGDVRRFRLRPEGVEKEVAATAAVDGVLTPIWIEQEPGSSGKNTIAHYQRTVLPGYQVRGERSTGSKEERAGPVSSKAEARLIELIRGEWNLAFLDEVEAFPAGGHDDQVDALSGAFSKLSNAPGPPKTVKSPWADPERTTVAVAPEQFHMADIAQRAESDRLAAYQRAWAAYDGEGPKALEDDDTGYDDNVRLDYAAVIVDKGVSFLAGKGGVTFQLEPPTEAEEDEAGDPEDEGAAEAAAEERLAGAQAKLDAAWAPEQRIVDFQKLATNGGICGHGWLRLYEDGRVSVLDPANCTAEWDADDVDVLRRYLVEWVTIDDAPESLSYELGVARRWRIEPNDPQAPTSWTIFTEEDDDTGEWRLIDEREWAHEYAPIIDCQNLPAPNTYYGRSDLEPAILDLLEQLESVASDMRRMVRLMGHPIPVFFGVAASQIVAMDVSIGKAIAIGDKEGSLSQLQIAELNSSLLLYQELKTSLLEATRVPKVALGETQNSGPVAAVALKVEYEPLVEKTETKRLTYGPAVTRAAECILDLAGLAGWTVTLGWPELIPSDPAAEALADEGELRMGIVSKQTIAEKRGYDWSIEAQRIAEEAPSFDAGEPELPGGGLVLPEGE